MNEILKQFYDNKPMLSEVKSFMEEMVKEHALSELFKGHDAKPSAEAKVVVELAFSRLKELYEPKIKRTIINKSR